MSRTTMATCMAAPSSNLRIALSQLLGAAEYVSIWLSGTSPRRNLALYSLCRDRHAVVDVLAQGVAAFVIDLDVEDCGSGGIHPFVEDGGAVEEDDIPDLLVKHHRRLRPVEV